MERYKIISIKHTGTCGAAGTDRTDGIYPDRIGRICMKPNPIGLIPYIAKADGSSYYGKALFTSDVQSFEEKEDRIIMTTRNSIYEFKGID